MGLFSKLIDKLRGKSERASEPSRQDKPAAGAQNRPNGGRRRNGGRGGGRPAEGRNADGCQRRDGGAKMRGPRPKSVTAVPSGREGEAPAPVSSEVPRQPSEGRERRGERSERKDRPRRERGDRPRGPKGDSSERRTPRGQARPGGAFTPEQLAEYAAAHAAWDPASYDVPAEEGKIRFSDLNLPSEILHAVADLGFRYCTPIQAESLGYSLEGKNVAGRAQTGTGKTAAFLIAILTRYLRTPEKRLRPGAPRALVLAPTRELVIQICKDAEALGRYCGDVRSLAVYGGMDYERQREELEDAPVDILVATPGRLLDFVRGHVVDLHQVDTLVIDEADRMLDMGFIPDVRAIVNRMPDRDHRCTMLYSATLNETVMRLASMWMRDPVRVEIASESLATDTVRQVVYIARADEKFRLLYNHLARYADARTIVFCNRKSTTERVCDGLRRRGIHCEMLSGDVAQAKRMKVLDAFRAGTVRTVVATDVAGRGIHVDDVAFVVNFDFPYEPEDYVHRIGRTGRAGHTGTAISFADEDESFIIPDIEKYINETLKCTMPEEWMYAELPAPEPRRSSGRGERGDRGRRRDRRPEPSAEPSAAAPAGPAPEQPAGAAAETPEASETMSEAAEDPAEATATETPAPEPVVASVPVAEMPAAEAAPVSEASEPVAERSASEAPVAEPAASEPETVNERSESPGAQRAPAVPAAASRRQRPPRGSRPNGGRRQGGDRPRQGQRPGKPPRNDRPTAARFEQRTQAQGPRDGSESHHAAATPPRPIYVPPGAAHRSIISDEWTPGQK